MYVAIVFGCVAIFLLIRFASQKRPAQYRITQVFSKDDGINGKYIIEKTDWLYGWKDVNSYVGYYDMWVTTYYDTPEQARAEITRRKRPSGKKVIEVVNAE